MIILCALLIVTNIFIMEIKRNAEESPLLFVYVTPLTVLRIESFAGALFKQHIFAIGSQLFS
jgi:hypothetical protein